MFYILHWRHTAEMYIPAEKSWFFLATLVALHFTLVSDSVVVSTSIASRLASLFYVYAINLILNTLTLAFVHAC